MKKDFSTKWKASTQPRKQRKYAYNAPLHLRGRYLSAGLDKQLSQKHGIKRLRIKEGDKVKVVRGGFKGKEGKVEKTDINSSKVMISGIETVKKDGSKSRPMIHASNLVITDINKDDKKRLARNKVQSKTADKAGKNQKKPNQNQYKKTQ